MMKAIFAKGTAALAGAFTLLIILGSVAAYVVSVAGAELAGSTRLVITAAGWSIVVILAAVALGAAGVALFTVSNHAERWLTKRSERRLVDKENDLTIVTAPANHQIHVSDARRIAAPFTPLHLPAADPFQARAWLEWHQMVSRPAARIESKPAPQLAAGEVMLDLLPAIAALENVLIVGGKGTGKTTLMQWLAAIRAELGRVLIFDSHAHPAKWPAGHVVGKGRDYQTIWSGMLQLVDLLDRRYKDFAAGAKHTGEFGTITNMIDELTLLPGIIKDLGGDIQAYNKPLLTEGRKVDLCAVWGVHSDRVDALGLKGAADLKECFDAVVYLKNIAGQRYALVDFGEGIDKAKRYRLPGPFVLNAQPAQLAAGDIDTDQAQPVWQVAPETESAEVERQPERPSAEDEAVMVAFFTVKETSDGGPINWAEVCRQANLTPGGKQYDRIKAILGRWGVRYE
jgi:hypothetical protein